VAQGYGIFCPASGGIVWQGGEQNGACFDGLGMNGSSKDTEWQLFCCQRLRLAVSLLLITTAIFALRFNFPVDLRVHARWRGSINLVSHGKSLATLLNIKIVLRSATKDCRLCYNHKNIPVSMPRKVD
jgi:hypothetical protein